MIAFRAERASTMAAENGLLPLSAFKPPIAPATGTDVVDLVVQGGLLEREQAASLLIPLPS
ncbi:hypothetical protein ACWEWG_38695 [Streptomyces sp. NPDC003758]|jgi:hypothetical protein|uniref:Uncharacterized protein n=1 Tax=Streptomyces cynarae TaxID=2981134 RepID=A0ABY6DVC1_9ACTN|nr:hypothetical protein [Streptomyces cynarae]UXY18335.1 hypothetical protein N8I84_06075 [Streptomyces cynarae]